jgi:hypothetical protein
MMQGVRHSVILIFSLQLLKIALRNCGYNLHALMNAKGGERPINNTLKRVVKTLFIQTYDTVDCNSTLSFFFLHAHELLKADLFLFLLGVFQFLQNSRELLKLQAKLFFMPERRGSIGTIFFSFSPLSPADKGKSIFLFFLPSSH